MFKNWSNRDWFWLVSIFLGVIVIILTWRLNDNDSVVNIIAMFSSGASIILALVAIVQSTMYNNSANELNARVTEKISVMESNVQLIKDNLFQDVKKVIDNSSIDPEAKEEIQNDLYYAMQEKGYPEHPAVNGRAYEILLSRRLKNIFSNDFSIKSKVDYPNQRVDIILENQSKIVFIEVRVASQISIYTLKNTSSRLNMIMESESYLGNKSISGLIVVITDKKVAYEEKIDEKISVVNLTKRQVVAAGDDIIKREMMV